MPDLTPAELLDTLAEMIGNLNEHIEQRGQEIAKPRIAAAREEYLEIRADMEQEAAINKQRSEDLVVELRRQLNHAVRRAERAEKKLADLQRTDTP
jgi:hypothetical protein